MRRLLVVRFLIFDDYSALLLVVTAGSEAVARAGEEGVGVGGGTGDGDGGPFTDQYDLVLLY